MARNISERSLFEQPEDCGKFLELLQRGLAKTGFTLYDWSLVNNHYHLIIKTNSKRLEELMRPLNSAYARYYNDKYDRRGSLFDGRYKSIVALSMDYLHTLLGYVDLNPLRAGLCKDLESLAHHEWCGFSAIMGNRICTFQDTETVLRSYTVDPATARAQHRRFVEQALRKPEKEELEVICTIRRTNHEHFEKNDPSCWILGDVEADAAAYREACEKLNRMGRLRRKGWNLASLAAGVEQHLDLQPGALRIPYARGPCADARRAFAYLAYRVLGETQVATGAYMGISGQAVSRMIAQGERVARERKLDALLERLEGPPPQAA
jgi:REP element-mobilizing transposase RayT